MTRALVTMGTCDGVHLGHQRLVRWILKRAGELRLSTTAVLFERPPRFFFRPELAAPLLTTGAERRSILLGMGMGRVKLLRFGRRLAETTHGRFFERFLLGTCRAGGIFVGPDFAFGKGRKGDIPWLKGACRERGIEFGMLPMVKAGKAKISSSHIRALLLEGKAQEAARLLGRPHFLTGVVVRGKGVGGRLGFPTANLRIPSSKLAPRGVYKVRVTGPGILRWGRPAACNVGTRPTVGGRTRVHVEVHIPGFRGSLYGKALKVEFLRRLRAEKRFPSLEALQAQIRRDVSRI